MQIICGVKATFLIRCFTEKNWTSLCWAFQMCFGRALSIAMRYCVEGIVWGKVGVCWSMWCSLCWCFSARLVYRFGPGTVHVVGPGAEGTLHWKISWGNSSACSITRLLAQPPREGEHLNFGHMTDVTISLKKRVRCL